MIRIVILLFAWYSACFSLEVLHLSFHMGCLKEFEGVAEELDISVTNWYIPDLPKDFFDPGYNGNALYNIGHDRAQRIWNRHAPYFNQFDAVIITDTAPLSRIFLQNAFTKQLIIWISNRFDYSDGGSLDCNFPDSEYYDLISRAKELPNVSVLATTQFEHFYAKRKGVDTGMLVINPCGAPFDPPSHPLIPGEISKKKMFYIPPYENENNILINRCKELQLNHYSGPFNSPLELIEFKGIIHLPYSYCNIALFMNMQLGIPYFVPSKQFLEKLLNKDLYWHQNAEFLKNSDRYDLSEWYVEERKDVITYFHSWSDLKEKIDKSDFNRLRQKTLEYAKEQRAEMISRWRNLFDGIKLNAFGI